MFIRVSNHFNLDQDLQSVGLYLNPSCLQSLSADGKSGHYQKVKFSMVLVNTCIWHHYQLNDNVDLEIKQFYDFTTLWHLENVQINSSVQFARMYHPIPINNTTRISIKKVKSTDITYSTNFLIVYTPMFEHLYCRLLWKQFEPRSGPNLDPKLLTFL